MEGLSTLRNGKQHETWGGASSKKTYGQTIDTIAGSCRNRVDGVASLRLNFRHSALGRDMVEAGHVTGSREYAKGGRPIQGPERSAQGSMGESRRGL